MTGTATMSACCDPDRSRRSLNRGPSGLSRAQAQKLTAKPRVARASIKAGGRSEGSQRTGVIDSTPVVLSRWLASALMSRSHLSEVNGRCGRTSSASGESDNGNTAQGPHLIEGAVNATEGDWQNTTAQVVLEKGEPDDQLSRCAHGPDLRLPHEPGRSQPKCSSSTTGCDLTNVVPGTRAVGTRRGSRSVLARRTRG